MYDLANYWDINFNSFSKAMTTLFCLMAVNNWHVITSGYVAVTSEAARFFFMIYFVVLVVLVLNVVITFFIDIFSTQLSMKATEKLEERRQARLARERSGRSDTGNPNPEATFGTQPITPVEPDPTDMWFASPADESDGAATRGWGVDGGSVSSLVEWKILNRVAARAPTRPVLRYRLPTPTSTTTTVSTSVPAALSPDALSSDLVPTGQNVSSDAAGSTTSASVQIPVPTDQKTSTAPPIEAGTAAATTNPVARTGTGSIASTSGPTLIAGAATSLLQSGTSPGAFATDNLLDVSRASPLPPTATELTTAVTASSAGIRVDPQPTQSNDSESATAVSAASSQPILDLSQPPASD